jgi:stalled ribosome alternative rescue factor ArfA
MAIKFKISKRNFIAKDLKTTKYRPRVVKAKKGKGSFKRKKASPV